MSIIVLSRRAQNPTHFMEIWPVKWKTVIYMFLEDLSDVTDVMVQCIFVTQRYGEPRRLQADTF